MWSTHLASAPQKEQQPGKSLAGLGRGQPVPCEPLNLDLPQGFQLSNN